VFPASAFYAVEKLMQIRIGEIVKVTRVKIVKAFLNESYNGTGVALLAGE
jgi:hypothetical protein